MINLNEMEVGKSYILTLRDGEQIEMTCCNKYDDYVNFGYSNWNVYFDGKYKDYDLPSLDIISYCKAPLTEVEELRKQLQANEEEIKELTKVVKMYRESDFQETVTDLENNNKSLQTKLQQAKEGLEFYAKAKHFEEHSHYDIMLEWGEKAREALEIINKEQDNGVIGESEE